MRFFSCLSARWLAPLLLLPICLLVAPAQKPVPALEAARKMTVPDGFTVTLFACEPDVVQPMSFCIDDRGRLWINENLNYQTRGSHLSDPLGRISILEDTNGDGRFDKKKVFADKIFFPSGIEVGFGGVFVGSPPNLLFIPDRDGDDKPDGPPEVLLDGFGINDRHETMNSFIWGPDGWLYGCHGVFTQALVGKPNSKPEDRVRFNAAWFRYHPVTKKFELFAEGGSNQWGVDFDDHGQAFATACVIPHLWHVAQGGRYQRQAGPHTLPYVYGDIKTIADHSHQGWNKRQGGFAHGGARVYLGDNFPPEYRGRLLMGNIHHHCIYTDLLERKGSGFVGKHGEDFAMANDNMFIGFNLELGPEGALYIIDWYDSDICGRKIDDEHTGRVFRISYRGVKEIKDLDLKKLDDLELVKLQLHANDWHVRHARRILHERAAANKLDAKVHAALREILDGNPNVTRKLRALWALHATGGADEKLLLSLLDHPSDYLRAWSIQLLLEGEKASPAVQAKLEALAHDDPSQLVRLYLASALQRLPVEQRWKIAAGLLTHAEDAGDQNLPLMYFYGLEPLVGADKPRALRLAVDGKIPLVRQYMVRRATEN